MKDNVLHGSLRSYLRWPLFLCPLLIAMNVHLYFYNTLAGVIVTGYLVIYIAIAAILFFYRRTSLLHDLVQFSMRLNETSKTFYDDFSFPVSILNNNGAILWSNKLFNKLFQDNQQGKNISHWIPAINESSLPENEKETQVHFRIETNYYKASMKKITLEDTEHTESYLGIDESAIILSIYDETELVCCMNENKEQRLSVGLLYIDNYEETLETVDEVKRSLFSALIDRKINKYMMSIDAITKKLEKDKYIFLFQHKYLAELQSKKFSILDEIRDINVGEEINVTISIGIGVHSASYKKRQEYARTAIDLALGRGGDQVVVKTPDNILYYGGKNIHLEKNTRVKARVKAHALKESIEAAEKIIVMGHDLPDVDSLGAAIGVYRIAKTFGKTTHIVINKVSSSLKPVLQLFQNNPEYEDDLFVTGSQAKGIITAGSLLVVVDVNRPSYTDAPELLELTNTIVILDHHRKTGEFFKNPILSYVEPFASSACEMVAEILQYVGEEIKLKPFEADALYAGIMVDTNNFMNKPGIRTFEAVAYLRRQGADITRIRKMFRTDMAEYKVRAEAIQNTEIFMDYFAIAFCNAVNLESPTIVGAKISDELLDINSIKASFVLTAWGEKVYISARSIDEVNVQLIMERLGGGGHATCAGAQLEGCTLEEASDTLRNTLQTMKDEGDLL